MSNGDIVPERGEDDKSPLTPWFIPLSLLLIAFISFGFGRLSVGAVPEPVKISSLNTFEAQGATVAKAVTPVGGVKGEGSYVASKNGKKYYPLTCSGVNRIKEENKIYFKTQAEAEAAGYSKAANCVF